MAYDDPLTFDRPTKTDLYCHSCGKNFIAMLDYTLDGNHAIQCPTCSHLHYRVIKQGKVTSERYDSDYSHEKPHSAKRVWKSSVIAATTTSASAFIFDRWIDKVR